MRKSIIAVCMAVIAMTLTGCFGAKSASSSGRGGEVVGVGGGKGFTEP